MEVTLERVGSTSPNEWLHIPPSKMVVFGRAVTCDIRLYSEFISRQHAKVERTDNKIYITDLKSVNGVHVNSIKLNPNEPHVICVGDEVEIGKPSDENEWGHLKLCDRFVYVVKEEISASLLSRPQPSRIHKSLICVKKREKRCKATSETDQSCIKIDVVPDIESIKVDDSARKRLLDADKVDTQASKVKFTAANHSEPDSAEAKLAVLEERLLAQRREASTEKQKLEDEFKKQVELLKAELSSYESKLLESTSSGEKEELLKKETELTEKLKEMKRKEEQESAELRRKEEELKVKEEQLKEQLLKEKTLARQREEEAALLARADAEARAKKSLVGLIEEELQCIVCSEPFIKSTTLNCSHTFCKFCIDGWLKKKSICPVCQREVTSRNPSLVLDNYIDTVISEMSPELQERRKAVIEERVKSELSPKPKRKRKRR